MWPCQAHRLRSQRQDAAEAHGLRPHGLEHNFRDFFRCEKGGKLGTDERINDGSISYFPTQVYGLKLDIFSASQLEAPSRIKMDMFWPMSRPMSDSRPGTKEPIATCVALRPGGGIRLPGLGDDHDPNVQTADPISGCPRRGGAFSAHDLASSRPMNDDNVR